MELFKVSEQLLYFWLQFLSTRVGPFREYICCCIKGFLCKNLHDMVNRADEEICELKLVTPWILVTPLQNFCKIIQL